MNPLIFTHLFFYNLRSFTDRFGQTIELIKKAIDFIDSLLQLDHPQFDLFREYNAQTKKTVLETIIDTRLNPKTHEMYDEHNEYDSFIDDCYNLLMKKILIKLGLSTLAPSSLLGSKSAENPIRPHFALFLSLITKRQSFSRMLHHHSVPPME